MRKIILSITCAIILGLPESPVAAPIVNPPTITTPWGWNITSDFGPRVASSNASWLHYGIDYAGPLGASLPAVEAGTIVNIQFGGGWYISINGNHGKW